MKQRDLRPTIDVTVAAATDPVTADEAKLHTRITNTAQNAVVERLIKTATEWCQACTQRQFVTATKIQRMITFPDEIFLFSPPLGAITTFAYTDVNGDGQTLTANTQYVKSKGIRGPTAISPAEGTAWPAVSNAPYDNVEITFTCGYGQASAVPPGIIEGILLLTAHWYFNREATGKATGEIGFSVRSALSPFVVGHQF